MKTTNRAQRKTTATAVEETTVAAGRSGRTVSPASETNSIPSICTRLLRTAAHSRLQNHRAAATRLWAAPSDSATEVYESPTITPPSYRGLFRRGVNRLLFRGQDLDDATGNTEITQPRISPIEPNLYMVPESLHRYYRPLPGIARAFAVCLSTWAAFASTDWKRIQPPGLSFLLIRRIATLLAKSVAFSLIAQVVLQDTLFARKARPSRVTMKTLLQNYFLPSPLSKYEPVTIGPTEKESPFTLGVHYLQYDNNDINVEGKEEGKEATNYPTSRRSFGAMYFQHGFGASSLSWLPVLPTLAKQMNARVALGHDTVGFGFTDRPKDAGWFRPRQSARIAEAIMRSKIDGSAGNLPAGDGTTGGASPAQPVCLVGHSMGSRATLRLAARLPVETPKLIILSSPALGLIAPKHPKPTPTSSFSSKAARLASCVVGAISRRIVRPVSKYALRRIIGTDGFWRKGLEGVWGDPAKVAEDDDVLRYSWPSIGYGWEEGILQFATAQFLPTDDALDDDLILMRRVLDLPNTKVLVVLGSRDNVIRTRAVETFLEQVHSLGSSSTKDDDEMHNVPVVELEGLGHCAFEEDREAFCNAVERLVRDHWDTRL